jgi:hypothetical protein
MKTFDLPYHRRNFLIYLCMLLEREIRYNQRAKPSVFPMKMTSACQSFPFPQAVCLSGMPIPSRESMQLARVGH